MRHVRTRWRAAALAAAVALVASGCGLTHIGDLSFRVDKRLHFLSPHSRATVRQPFTVSWRMDDFRIAGPHSELPSKGAGYFVVFVDKTPIQPGKTLRSVGSNDPQCKADPKCPDDSYLNQRYIYPTTSPHITLSQIPNLPGHESLQLHTITVILVDTSGRRIGESSWELDVRMRRIG